MSQASSPSWEQTAIDSALEWYTSQGFEVQATAPGEVPFDLKRFGSVAQLAGLVDFVATRRGETVFVEVRRTGPGHARRERDLEAFARLVESVPGARLDVISLPHPSHGLPTYAGLLQVLATTEILLAPDGNDRASLQAAVAMGGLALEGALQVISARNAVTSNRDLGIGSIAADLEVEGVLAPSDSAFIEGFASIRNLVAHGLLENEPLSTAEVEWNIRNIRRLVDLAFMDGGDLIASFTTAFVPASQTEEGPAQTVPTPDEPDTRGPVIHDGSEAHGSEESRVVLDTRTIIELYYASVPDAVREDAIAALDEISRFWRQSDEE